MSNTVRRDFLKQAACLAVGAQALTVSPWLTRRSRAAEGDTIGETTSGKIRGRMNEGIHVFKGVPFGADTSGKNRFMRCLRKREATSIPILPRPGPCQLRRARVLS